MATKNDIPELLRQGIEAARAGNKAQARDFFEQVTELDENNEKGWFWLASVVDTDEERRICLSNVLHINPSNEKAQRAMAALEEKLKDKKRQQQEEEVIAGVPRQQFNLILGGGIVLVLVILIIGIVVIIGNNNRIQAQNQAATSVAVEATTAQSQQETQQAQGTSDALAIGATQTALVPTEIPVTLPSPTSNIATLPPEWTDTPAPTLEVAATPLPAPLGLSGRLVVWGGVDELNTTYLPVGYYDLDFGNQYHRIGDDLGKYVSITLNGQRVVYERYDPLLFSSAIEAINLNSTEPQNIAEFYAGNTIVEPKMPNFDPFGQKVTFVAKTQTRNFFQVFVVDLGQTPEGASRVKQLTDDDIDYSYPVFSPDGTHIAAVRTDLNSANPGVDLVNIDASSGGKFLITNDLATTVETQPHWTRDGRQVVYAAAPATAPDNHDIFIHNADGTGSALPIYRSPVDSQYPILSPDQRYVAFSSPGTSGLDIFIYDQSSQALWQLTSGAGNDFPGGWWQPNS